MLNKKEKINKKEKSEKPERILTAEGWKRRLQVKKQVPKKT